MKQSKKEILLEILRFLIVGGIATICDYAVFYTLNIVAFNRSKDFWPIFCATASGFIVGLLVNWFLQKFVFKYIDESQTKSKKVFIKFVVLSLIGLGITELGIELASPLYDTVTWHIFIDFDFWKLFFKCLMTGIVLIINYIGRKIFVFKVDNKTEEDTSSSENA